MKTELKKRDGITTVQKVVYESDLVPTADGEYIKTNQTIKQNLAALDSAIHTGGAGSVVTVEKLTTAESGYAATYIVKQGGSQVGASINIPKDYLVKNAELKTVETADTPYTGAEVGDKYIDFTVNTTDASGTAQHIYLPVKDLVDVYTSGSAAGDMVVVAVNGNNQITATITDGTVTKAKLASGVQASLEKADSALQASDITGKAEKSEMSITDVSGDSTKKTITLNSDLSQDVLVAHQDISGKADKVSGATSGNFAGLDANGNLTDSGYKASDFQAAGDYKTIQTAVTDPTASGNATSFIDTISQDTNGVITATKKTIPEATTSAAGLMSAADKTKLDGVATGAQVNVLESVKVNGSALGITDKAVDIPVDGTFDATTNKIATVSTVTTAIDGLDVNEYAQAAIDTTTTSGETTVKISGIKETDGKIAAGTSTVDLVLDGTYNASTNKIATVASVSGATSGKADKVSGATNGNFAGLDSNGNLTDSGKKAADFKEKQTAVSDPTANGNAIAFIDSISQNANGEVTVTKKTVDTDNSTIGVSNSKLQVKAAGIDTAQLKDGAVTTDKLGASAVTSAKIADGAVGTAKLANLTSFKLVDTANDGSAYEGQVYQITIDHGVLTVTPVAS